MKEITGKVQKKNQSIRTTIEAENGIISDKNAIAEEFNTFFVTRIGPNLTNKIPQIGRTLDQYFLPFDTQINHHALTLKKIETSYKSLERSKAAGTDDINSNIVLGFFEELKPHYFTFSEPRQEKEFFLTKLKCQKLVPYLKEVKTCRLKIIDQSQSIQYSQRYLKKVYIIEFIIIL